MLFGFFTGASMFLAGFFYSRFDLSFLLIPVLFAACWLGMFLAAFLFLCIICAVVDTDKPQEHDSKFYRAAMHIYIEALISLVRLHVTVEGLEKTPKEGRFLLVCNHQNEADPGILLHYFRSSQLAFISKQENKTMFAVGKFMHKIMCQLVDRENDRQALKVILKCIQLIREDEVSIGVFPEGGIKVKGKLSPFRPGVFKIAQKANVPIVVCTLKGTHKLFHNILRLKPTHVQLHLVDVIPAEELVGRTTVEISDRVHAMMQESLGEEYRLDEAENT